jgi:hypothetical protein
MYYSLTFSFEFFLTPNYRYHQSISISSMADDKDHPSNNQNRDWPHESNPFVAFRRYADEQVSTMLQSITGLPSTVTPPHNDRWEIFADDHGYESRTTHKRIGDHSDRNYPNDGNNCNRDDRGRDDRDYRNNSRRWYNSSSDFFNLESLFSPLASNFFHPHNFFLDMFDDTDSPTWPITYIMFSPYSPLNLERQAKFRANRENGVFSSIISSLYLDAERDSDEPQWREAFEDLLRLENGKPMLNHEAVKYESGKDWLQGLVKRGSLGDRWKYVSGTEGQPWSGITFAGRTQHGQDHSRSLSLPESKEEQKAAETELDLYERFLNDIENRERGFSRSISESPLLRLLLAERKEQQEELEKYRHGVPKVEDKHSDDNETRMEFVSGNNKPSVPKTLQESMETKRESLSEPVQAQDQCRVVSTMTRTERVRLADGSVQSTIINSKRFADGREENDTSVEVSHPQSEGPESESAKSKSGWFWKD